MKNTRVSGHTLRREGAPYHLAMCNTCHENLREHGVWNDDHATRTTGPTGHAICSCGAISSHLKGVRERQRWHFHHKALMRQEQTGEA